MIYFLLLAVLFCFAFYEIYSGNQKQSDRLFLISIVMLVLLDGLRWETGTDWHAYERYFETSDRPSAEYNYFEIGYVIITRIFKTISDSYTLFLFAHSIFCYSLIGSTIKKYAKFPLLTLALYYCIMLPYQGMNRQYMAMAILIFSIRYIFSRSLWRFLICLVLAFLFHRSSLIFIFAYWMARPQKLAVYIAIYVVFVLIALSGIVNRIPPELFYFMGDKAGDKADQYMYVGAVESSIIYTLMSIAKRSLWIVAVLLYYKAFINIKHFALYYNSFFFASCILLVIGNSAMQAFGRSLLTYTIFEAFVIPYLLFIFKENQTRIIMFCVVVLYGVSILSKSFIYQVEILGESPFIPYKCVLFQ